MSKTRGTRKQAAAMLRQPLCSAEPDLSHVYKLVVVRESDSSDMLLFEGMAYKTIEMLIHDHPALESLLRDPMDPVHHPEKWSAVVVRRKGTRSIRFVIDGVIVLYHLGSAVKVNEDEDMNFFTEVLLDLVETYRIRNVFAYAAHRLVRDKDQGKLVDVLFSKLGVLVTLCGYVVDFSAPSGSILWTLLALIADQERRGIVERNRLGRIAVSRRNEWPHGPKTIPLGYRLKGKRLVPDKKELERVNRILNLMADATLSTRQFALALGAMKVTRPRVTQFYGEDATVDQVRHPRDIFRSFANLLPLYEFGRYEMALPNPTKNATVFGGLPVLRSSPDDMGIVILPYEFGVPSGGWAEPEVFEAIRAKLEDNKRFVNGTRQRRPFGGRPSYEIDGVRYQLDSNSASSYRLRKHRFTAVEHVNGTKRIQQSNEVETIAAITCGDLHREVINGIVNAISACAGVTGQLVANSLRVDQTPEEALSRTFAFLESRAERAREEVLRAADPASALAFRTEAERLEGLIAELRAQPSKVEERKTATSVNIDTRSVIENLAKVAKSGQQVPGEVLEAMQRLIPSLQLSPTDDHTVLRWSAMVHLPTLEGDVLRLGPIRGTVPAPGCGVRPWCSKRMVSKPSIAISMENPFRRSQRRRSSEAGISGLPFESAFLMVA